MTRSSHKQHPATTQQQQQQLRRQFLSSDHASIDHPIERSILGTCAVTLVFLVLALVLLAPFLLLLVPSVVLAVLLRLLLRLCPSAVGGPTLTTGTDNSAYYSPEESASAEETRWLHQTHSPSVLLLLVLDAGISLESLRNLLLNRVVLARRARADLDAADRYATMDSSSAAPSNQQQHQQPQDSNREYRRATQLAFPRFSQIPQRFNIGWKWSYDRQFDIDNHVRAWKMPTPASILSSPDKLSALLSHIDRFPLDISSQPAWDAHLVVLQESIHSMDLVSSFHSRKDPDAEADPTNQRCLLVFRVHPSLSDGVSLVHLLATSLADDPQPLRLKRRFFSSGKLFNAIRAVFVGPVVLLQKWLLTRRDQNVFHGPRHKAVNSMNINNNNSSNSSINNNTGSNNSSGKHCGVRSSTTIPTEPSSSAPTTKKFSSTSSSAEYGDRSFYYCSYPLSTVTRIKSITRSTITELFLATVAGALRTYQQQMCDVAHPYDLLALLPTDLSKDRRRSRYHLDNSTGSNHPTATHNSTPGRYGNSSSGGRKLSGTDSSEELFFLTSAAEGPNCGATAPGGATGQPVPPPPPPPPPPPVNNNYSLVEFELPTNTEGCVPRLWQVKLRMEQLKSSADSLVLAGLGRWLRLVWPPGPSQSLLRHFYDKASVLLACVQGPRTPVRLGGRRVHLAVYWVPVLAEVRLGMGCISYGDQLLVSISGDRRLPRLRLLLDSVLYQMDLLNKLLEHRRIPGEHKSQRFPSPAVAASPTLTSSTALSADREANRLPSSSITIAAAAAALSAAGSSRNLAPEDRAHLLAGHSPTVTSEHLYGRLTSIQNQLQNDDDLSGEELDSLRTEFSSLMGILRRRKSCGIDTNGESADFDEELEEMPEIVTGSSARRPSLSGLMVLSTSRRRSLAASLARPLNTGHRSRSNSRPGLHVSSLQLAGGQYVSQSQLSPSSSQRPSLMLTQEDVDDHEGPSISFRSSRSYDTTAVTSQNQLHLQHSSHRPPDHLRAPNNPDSPFDNSTDSPSNTTSATTSQRSSPINGRPAGPIPSGNSHPARSTNRRLREDRV